MALLKRYGGGARLVAGGTDILVDLKQANIVCSHLIGLSGLDELRGIGLVNRGEEERLRIGALAMLNQVARSSDVKDHIPALSEAALSMSSNQIRNMGTMGGNIASGVPSADMPPTLIAAGAWVEMAGPEGKREVPLCDLFLGPRRTVLGKEEILTAVLVPLIPSNTGISYMKFKLRGANALAVVSVAAGITLEHNTITSATIVLGAVGPIPLVARKASSFLVGQVPGEQAFRRAASMSAEESRPISDIRGSREYRKHLVEVLAFRAVEEACRRVKEGS